MPYPSPSDEQDTSYNGNQCQQNVTASPSQPDGFLHVLNSMTSQTAPAGSTQSLLFSLLGYQQPIDQNALNASVIQVLHSNMISSIQLLDACPGLVSLKEGFHRLLEAIETFSQETNSNDPNTQDSTYHSGSSSGSTTTQATTGWTCQFCGVSIQKSSPYYKLRHILSCTWRTPDMSISAGTETIFSWDRGTLNANVFLPGVLVVMNSGTQEVDRFTMGGNRASCIINALDNIQFDRMLSEEDLKHSSSEVDELSSMTSKLEISDTAVTKSSAAVFPLSAGGQKDFSLEPKLAPPDYKVANSEPEVFYELASPFHKCNYIRIVGNQVTLCEEGDVMEHKVSLINKHSFLMWGYIFTKFFGVGWVVANNEQCTVLNTKSTNAEDEALELRLPTSRFADFEFRKEGDLYGLTIDGKFKDIVFLNPFACVFAEDGRKGLVVIFDDGHGYSIIKVYGGVRFGNRFSAT
ncbi:hypothetical protein BJ741DRAFT_640620 [Chytriomyces cf. hyalinus JEL632]|nr:hypothetical protein BJ741DRAFT_640620 [Chytriomyces cf. hyalinus JEL632]